MQWSREAVETVESGALVAGGTTVARLRLTILDDGVVFDVLVGEECYDAVAVGDPWPSEHAACR